MKAFIQDWFRRKWTGIPPEASDYLQTFSSPSGQRVFAHLMDNVYCTIYEGGDPIQLALHAGRRSVVQEMLEIMDSVESPNKARFKPIPTEEYNGIRYGRTS